MEMHGSLHCRWKWKLLLFPSTAASVNIFRGSCRELPYTPTYFHLPRVSQTSSYFHKTSIRVYRPPFHLLPWKFPPTSMETSIEVNLLRSRQLPLLLSVTASTNIFRGSFPELPHTRAYFHLLPRVSQTSNCFHKTNPNTNPTLELPTWKMLPTSKEVDGSTCK